MGAIYQSCCDYFKCKPKNNLEEKIENLLNENNFNEPRDMIIIKDFEENNCSYNKQNNSNHKNINKNNSLNENKEQITCEMDYLNNKGEKINLNQKDEEETKLKNEKKNFKNNEKDIEKLESEQKDLLKKIEILELENKSLKAKEGLEKSKIDKNREDLEKKEKELKLEKSEIDKNREDLEKKEKELKLEKSNIDKNREDLENNNKEVESKIKNMENMKEELEKRKNDIKKKEQELFKKEAEMSINFKAKELSINKQIIEISENKEALVKREESIKEKEYQIEKKETEITQFQKKLNQERLFYENQIQQREDTLKKMDSSLKDRQIFLEKEKKDFDEQKKKYELSKLPNEIGLRNIGATCYMNATLQAFSNTNKFTEYFLTKYNFNPNNNGKKMSNEMYKVLSNLWSEDKKKGDYPPEDFKKALSEENPLFAGIQANDSKDLINFLLERLHQELNNPPGNNQNQNVIINQMNEMQTLNNFIQEYFGANKSIISDCFYGLVETKSTCTGCKITKFNFQIYSFLEFPLQEVNTYMFQNGRRFSLVNPDGTNPDIKLYECFDYYQKMDYMTGQNQMYCNFCNGNRDTYYGTIIYSLPNYLIINLNRGKGATYKCNVFFPEVLNLINYISFKDGPTVMQLYAVICHIGPSSMSGHFIAYCKNRKNNKWYKYNDSIVTECTQANEFTQGMPYILFYKSLNN